MSSVLLINYSDRDAAKLEKAGITVKRGFISSAQTSVELGGEKSTVYRSDFPPIYENEVVLVNLNNSAEIDEKLKELKAGYYDESERENFYKYWRKFGVLIVQTGDFNWQDLRPLGVPDIELVNNHRSDTKVNSFSEKETDLNNLFDSKKNEIKMPSKQYIKIGKIWNDRESMGVLFNGDGHIVPIYSNFNNDVIGCLLDSEPSYNDVLRPHIIVLPQFSDNSAVIIEVLKKIANIYNGLLPELYDAKWHDSLEYLPQKIRNIANEIEVIKTNATKKIELLTKTILDEKTKYSSLTNLLTENGTILKDSVKWVFHDVMGLEVEDRDVTAKEVGDEDLIITYASRKILCEVKGTNAKSPSPTYITQLWKHLARSKAIGNEGALVLNFDRKTVPDQRPLAYAGKYEKDVADIIFLDTRVLHKYALAVIDGKIDKANALKSIFKVGRVDFND